MNDITGKGDDGDGILGLVLLWILFGAFILLIISPIDFIPELTTGPVGLIDDVVYGIVDLLIGALIYTRTKRRKKVKYEPEEKEVAVPSAELPDVEELPKLPEGAEAEESEGPKEP